MEPEELSTCGLSGKGVKVGRGDVGKTSAAPPNACVPKRRLIAILNQPAPNASASRRGRRPRAHGRLLSEGDTEASAGLNPGNLHTHRRRSERDRAIRCRPCPASPASVIRPDTGTRAVWLSRREPMGSLRGTNDLRRSGTEAQRGPSGSCPGSVLWKSLWICGKEVSHD